MTRCRVSKYRVQYSYMNFISGKSTVPPVLRKRGWMASAEISAMRPSCARSCVRSNTDCSGKPKTPSRMIDKVPTTSPSQRACSVVVVGRA